MARTQCTDDAETLDGAPTHDEAPDPADPKEDERVCAHTSRPDPRRAVSQVRRVQSQRTKNRRVVRRG